MDYSVFDWSARQYKVFRDQRPAPIMVDGPRCAPGVQPILGMVDVNAALCVLPPDAQVVGWSPTAVGRVVRLASGMSGIPAGGQRSAGSPNLGGV